MNPDTGAIDQIISQIEDVSSRILTTLREDVSESTLGQDELLFEDFESSMEFDRINLNNDRRFANNLAAFCQVSCNVMKHLGDSRPVIPTFLINRMKNVDDIHCNENINRHYFYLYRVFERSPIHFRHAVEFFLMNNSEPLYESLDFSIPRSVIFGVNTGLPRSFHRIMAVISLYIYAPWSIEEFRKLTIFQPGYKHFDVPERVENYHKDLQLSGMKQRFFNLLVDQLCTCDDSTFCVDFDIQILKDYPLLTATVCKTFSMFYIDESRFANGYLLNLLVDLCEICIEHIDISVLTMVEKDDEQTLGSKCIEVISTKDFISFLNDFEIREPEEKERFFNGYMVPMANLYSLKRNKKIRCEQFKETWDFDPDEVEEQFFGFLAEKIGGFVDSCVEKFTNAYTSVSETVTNLTDKIKEEIKTNYQLWITRALSFAFSIYLLMSDQKGPAAMMSIVGLSTFIVPVIDQCGKVKSYTKDKWDRLVQWWQGDSLPKSSEYAFFKKDGRTYRLPLSQLKTFIGCDKNYATRINTKGFYADSISKHLPSYLTSDESNRLTDLIDNAEEAILEHGWKIEKAREFVAPLVAFVGTVAESLTDGVSSLVKDTDWLKIGKYAASSLAIWKVGGHALDVLKYCITTVSLKLFDFDPFNNKSEEMVSIVKHLSKRLKDWDKKDITAANCSEFYKLYEVSYNYHNQIAGVLPPFTYKELTQQLIDKKSSYKMATTALFHDKKRIEPLGVMIVGPTEYRKSILVTIVCQHLYSKYFEGESEIGELHVVNIADRFDSGYIHQLFVQLDEFLQEQDKNKKREQVMKWIQFVNNAPFPLNTAFEDKGTVFFDSRAVFATTNTPNFETGLIQDDKAFTRRCHLVILPEIVNDEYSIKMSTSCPFDVIKAADRNAVICSGLVDSKGKNWWNSIDLDNRQHIQTNVNGLVTACCWFLKRNESYYQSSLRTLASISEKAQKVDKDKLKSMMKTWTFDTKDVNIEKDVDDELPIDDFEPLREHFEVKLAILNNLASRFELPQDDSELSFRNMKRAFEHMSSKAGPIHQNYLESLKKKFDIVAHELSEVAKRVKKPELTVKTVPPGQLADPDDVEEQFHFNDEEYDRVVQYCVLDGMVVDKKTEHPAVKLTLLVFTSVATVLAVKHFFFSTDSVEEQSVTYRNTKVTPREKKNQNVPKPCIREEALDNLVTLNQSIAGDLKSREPIHVWGTCSNEPFDFELMGFWITGHAFFTFSHALKFLKISRITVGGKYAEIQTYWIDMDADTCVILFKKEGFDARKCIKRTKFADPDIDYTGMNTWISYLEPKTLVVSNNPADCIGSVIQPYTDHRPIAWQHRIRSKPGYCGSLYYDSLGRIMGMHVAGHSDDKVAYSTQLDKAVYDGWINVIKGAEIQEQGPEQDFEVQPDLGIEWKEEPQRFHDTCLDIVGETLPGFEARNNRSTGLHRSDYYGMFGRLPCAPAKQTDEMLTKAMLKFPSDNTETFVEWEEEISEYMFEQYPPILETRVYSVKEGIEGVSGIKHVAGNTAIGRPFNLLEPGKSKKNKWFKYNEEGDVIDLDPKLLNHVDQHMKVLEDDRDPKDIFSVFGKQETLPLNHFDTAEEEIKDTRSIAVGSVAHTVNGRRLTMDLQLVLMSKPDNGFCSVGLDVHGTDPLNLMTVLRLKRCNHAIISDYKGFDRNIRSGAAKAVMKWILLWYKRSGATQKHLVALKHILSIYCECHFLLKNLVLRAKYKNPSGSFFTTFWNCLVNAFVLYSADLDQMVRVHGLNPWYSLHQIALRTYGDDNINAFCDDYMLDPVRLAKYIKEKHLMTITNTDKDGPPKLVRIEDIVYLSRSFEFVSEIRCPLALDTIKSILYYVRDDSHATLPSLVTSFAIEASHLTITQYNELKIVFDNHPYNVLNKIRLPSYLHSVSNRRRMYFEPAIGVQVGSEVAAERHTNMAIEFDYSKIREESLYPIKHGEFSKDYKVVSVYNPKAYTRFSQACVNKEKVLEQSQTIEYNSSDAICEARKEKNVQITEEPPMFVVVGGPVYKRKTGHKLEPIPLPKRILAFTGSFTSSAAAGTVLEHFGLMTQVTTIQKIIDGLKNFLFFTWDYIDVILVLQRPIQSSGCLLMYTSDSCESTNVDVDLWTNYEHVMTYKDSQNVVLRLPWNSMWPLAQHFDTGSNSLHEQYDIAVTVLNPFLTLGESSSTTSYQIYLSIEGFKGACPYGTALTTFPTVRYPRDDAFIMAATSQCNLTMQFNLCDIDLGANLVTPDVANILDTPTIRDLMSTFAFDTEIYTGSQSTLGNTGFNAIQFAVSVARNPDTTAGVLITGPTFTPKQALYLSNEDGLVSGAQFYPYYSQYHPIWFTNNLFSKWHGGFYVRLVFNDGLQMWDRSTLSMNAFTGNIFVTKFSQKANNNMAIIRYPDQKVLDFYWPNDISLPWIPMQHFQGDTPYSSSYEGSPAQWTLGFRSDNYLFTPETDGSPSQLIAYDRGPVFGKFRMYTKIGDGFSYGGIVTPTTQTFMKKKEKIVHPAKPVFVKTGNKTKTVTKLPSDWEEVRQESDVGPQIPLHKVAGFQEYLSSFYSQGTKEARLKLNNAVAHASSEAQAVIESGSVGNNIGGVIAAGVNAAVSGPGALLGDFIGNTVGNLVNYGVSKLSSAVSTGWNTVKGWFGFSSPISEVPTMPIRSMGEYPAHNDTNAPVVVHGNVGSTGVLTNGPPHFAQMRVQDDPLATANLLCRPSFMGYLQINNPSTTYSQVIEFGRKTTNSSGNWRISDYILARYNMATLMGELLLCFYSTPLQTATFRIYLLPRQLSTRNVSELSGAYESSLFRHEFTVRGDTTVKYALPNLDFQPTQGILNYGLLCIVPVSMSTDANMYCNLFVRIAPCSILAQPN